MSWCFRLQAFLRMFCDSSVSSTRGWSGVWCLVGPHAAPTLHFVWCGVNRMSCLRHDGGAWCAVPSLFVTKSFVGDNRSCFNMSRVSKTRYPIIPILAVWGLCPTQPCSPPCPSLSTACRRHATSHLAGSIARRY